MCDSTQVLTDIETQPNTENNLNHDNDESLVWGRLFPVCSVFKQIGNYLAKYFIFYAYN